MAGMGCALSVRASADAAGRTERVPLAEIRVHSSSFVVETCGRPEDGGIWNREWTRMHANGRPS